MLCRICRVYAAAGISVTVLGVGTAQIMEVMCSTCLIASMALSAAAAVLLGMPVLGAQNGVIAQFDKARSGVDGCAVPHRPAAPAGR